MKSLISVSAAVALLVLPVAGVPAHSAQSQSSAISCSRLNVNGTKPGELTVSVNGATVGTYSGDAGVYQDLEQRMQPGINRVRLSFAAPGEPGPFGTSAELRCLAPGVESSRDTILTLKPTAKKLSAEIDVNYVPR
jgi:hypothetical protein